MQSIVVKVLLVKTLKKKSGETHLFLKLFVNNRNGTKIKKIVNLPENYL